MLQGLIFPGPGIKKTEGEAFFRRWVLICCPTVFRDEELMSLEDLKDPLVMTKDYNILAKITTDEELSGLLNNVLKAWLRLKERGSFPKEWKNTEYIKGLWMMDVNPVKLFIDECCVVSPMEEEDYNTFYNTLNNFRVDHKAKPITKHMCSQWLTRIDVNKKRKGGGEYYYSGVSINDVAAEKYVTSNLDIVVEKGESIIDDWMEEF